MLSPNVIFKVYFGDEVFSTGVDACPDGDFGALESIGSGRDGGAGEALAIVSRSDMDVKIIFLGESFGATRKGTQYCLAFRKCSTWLRNTIARVLSLNMSL